MVLPAAELAGEVASLLGRVWAASGQSRLGVVTWVVDPGEANILDHRQRNGMLGVGPQELCNRGGKLARGRNQ